MSACRNWPTVSSNLQSVRRNASLLSSRKQGGGPRGSWLSTDLSGANLRGVGNEAARTWSGRTETDDYLVLLRGPWRPGAMRSRTITIVAVGSGIVSTHDASAACTTRSDGRLAFCFGMERICSSVLVACIKRRWALSSALMFSDSCLRVRPT
jgi:hypothetical protein